jgi:hypothetical protein
MLPELGLAAEESPHPAIQSAFTARFEGFLMIEHAGTYGFESKGTLTLNGETIVGARELGARSVRSVAHRRTNRQRHRAHQRGWIGVDAAT